MYSVIRNGNYLETEILLFGDIEVNKRPHEYSIFLNGEWVLDIDQYLNNLNKESAEEFLNNTDWKVTRHKEQCDLGITTSLTEEEYIALITERQKRREILNDINN